MDVLHKVKKCSADDSTLSTPSASGGDEQKDSAIGMTYEADAPNTSGRGDKKKERTIGTIPEKEAQVNRSDITSACKDLNKLTDEVSNEMRSLSISNKRTDPVTITASSQADIVGDSSSSSDTSVYKNEKKKQKINCEIREKGPSACQAEHVYQKVYGQLPTEMYGMLIERKRCLWEEFEDNEDQPLVGLGMFVMNEYIYLAKITAKLKTLEQQSCGPTITYAKNFWFNLSNPEHLFAFMYFMRCYYRVEHSMYLERLQEKGSRFAAVKNKKDFCSTQLDLVKQIMEENKNPA